jgi:hypothetical protein
MNIDQLSSSEKTHYTNLWCRQQGIKSRDLTNHPTIDDAILMIHIRNEFWAYFDSSDRGVWAAFWKRVYHLQFKLKPKHLKKIERIVNSGIYRQQQDLKAKEKIKAIRESTKENGRVHMTTNPLPATESLIGF